MQYKFTVSMLGHCESGGFGLRIANLSSEERIVTWSPPQDTNTRR